MPRNSKLDVDDVLQYLQDNEVKLEVRALGKRGTNLHIMLKVGNASTPLPRDATDPIMASVANLMTATGTHARKNPEQF